MRVLLKDKDDGTVFIMDATMVNYDPSHRILFCCSDDIAAVVDNISPAIADSIIKTLFQTGKADLSEYDAAPASDY